MQTLKKRYELLDVQRPRGARRNRLFKCLRVLGLVSICCLLTVIYFSIGFDDFTRQRTEPPDTAQTWNATKLPSYEQQAIAGQNVNGTARKSKEYMHFELFIGRKTKKIIFIETRVEKNFCLKLRQSCAVESAARLNSEAAVVLLLRSLASANCTAINELKGMPNVMIVRYTLDEVLDGTPLLDWGRKVERGQVKSPYMNSHLSDALRLALVHKYSAIYADLDFIMLRSFDELFKYEGFLAREDPKGLNGALFGFHGLKNFTRQAMKEFGATYRGLEWAFNGPHLMGRMLASWGCHVQDSDCHGLVILDPVVFYPIAWQQAKLLFNDENAELASNLMDNEKTLAIHFWNYLTHNISSPTGHRNVLNICAAEKCPTSFRIARKSRNQDLI